MVLPTLLVALHVPSFSHFESYCFQNTADSFRTGIAPNHIRRLGFTISLMEVFLHKSGICSIPVGSTDNAEASFFAALVCLAIVSRKTESRKTKNVKGCGKFLEQFVAMKRQIRLFTSLKLRGENFPQERSTETERISENRMSFRCRRRA